MRITNEHMQIGEVAERAALSLRTIRYYEEIELVVPSGRTKGGFRLYTEHDLERLLLVKVIKPLGLTLDEMRDMLSMREQLRAPSARAAGEARAAILAFLGSAEGRLVALRDGLDAAESAVRLLKRDLRDAPAPDG
ncbi:MAG: MerR family transcriptional regulator [Actinomycetota bacterium]